MGDKSGIEWTDATWNPVVGCTRVSAGCDNCYAVRSTRRLAGKLPLYQGLVNPGKGHFNGTVREVRERLDQPLRWKRPRRIFVNSMSDLFHPGVSFEFIAAVLGVMWYAHQHTFQILTKRPERALEWFRWISPMVVPLAGCHIQAGLHGINVPHLDPTDFRNTWPLPNVWLGTSVENQEAANERIPYLIATPAAVRFLSCEPLLGPIDLSRLGLWLYKHWDPKVGGDPDVPGKFWWEPQAFRGAGQHYLDWVIVGGESGPGHRPMEADWAREIRDQCAAVPSVAFFFKQVGGRTAKAGGRLLDGRVHDEWPS